MDIMLIKDTRTGKYAQIPRDSKLRDTISMGKVSDTLQEKTLTVVSGEDFVNLKYLNFTCCSRDTAKVTIHFIFFITNNNYLFNRLIMVNIF